MATMDVADEPSLVQRTESHRAARECLPGAHIRRRLFWRYSLVYDKPASDAVDLRGTETH